MNGLQRLSASSSSICSRRGRPSGHLEPASPAILIAATCLVLLGLPPPAWSGYVGCSFDDQICQLNEQCFDDLLFGRCIATDDEEQSRTEELFYRYDSLDQNQSSFLESLLDKLSHLGYKWDDDFSQCVLQTGLLYVRNGLDLDDDFFDVSLCGWSKDAEEKRTSFPELESFQVWTDDARNPDSVYFRKMQVSAGQPGSGMQWSGLHEHDGGVHVEPDLISVSEADSSELLARVESDPDQDPSPDEEDTVIQPEQGERSSDIFEDPQPTDLNSVAVVTRAAEIAENLQGIDRQRDRLFNRYKFKKRNEFDHLDGSYPELTGDPETLLYFPYTGHEHEDQAGQIFNRNERLDVKKPGPYFRNSANNFFLKKMVNDADDRHPDSDDNSRADSEVSGWLGTGDEAGEDLRGQEEIEMPLMAPVKDKRILAIINSVGQDPADPEDFVHIKLSDRLQTWSQGSKLISDLANAVGVPSHALSHRKIEDQHVQFRVEPNPQKLDAKAMVNLLNDKIQQKRMSDNIGVKIEKVSAGTEDGLGYTSLLDTNLMLGVSIAMATTAVLIMIILVIVLVQRRRRQQRMQQAKLDQEAQDSRLRDQYSQLCRDWSSTTKSTVTTGVEAPLNGSSTHTHSAPVKQMSCGSGRDSDGSIKSINASPWSEDVSNMDISTGHLVLAYMEDHLKNKQRLEQEWVALCGYEAEPCATSVAFKAENKKKNRYPDKLPYDHNRVTLNALMNKGNSDYINASTVTDHDPRNPSYIVTQGPLGQTVADFWQMVWEQGCVVIVMLTRLQDNGYQLCHRYWPEEGSEKFHIFEVHLVSEHVWCDDYLVRSVYLKNTRTGETRTVTQFHFRSWPAHGVPASTKALLEFRRKVNKSYRGRSCPIVVHCSDGVGRSGTYVLIDMVLNRLAKGCKEIDIAASLEHIRDQRGGMVQTRHQFEFCLMAVAEEVHAILKALPQ